MNVGLKVMVIVAIVSVVGWTSWNMIQLSKQNERQAIQIELEETTLEKKEIIRETIIRNRPVDNTNADDSLQYLRDR